MNTSNKDLILNHKEFAEIIIKRLEDKIKEHEEKFKKAKTEKSKIAIIGKIRGLTNAIEEMQEIIKQLDIWYE